MTRLTDGIRDPLTSMPFLSPDLPTASAPGPEAPTSSGAEVSAGGAASASQAATATATADPYADDPALSIRADAPAEAWTEAYPLGNGRMGAMVFGGVHTTRIALNEDSFWSGHKDAWQKDPQYDGRTFPPDPAVWDRAADLALEGKVRDAEDLLQTHFTGPYTQAYLPLGDLTLTLDHHEAPDAELQGYARVLDYRDAMTTVTYRLGETAVRRTTYVSHPDQLLIVRIEAEGGEGLDVSLSLDAPLPAISERTDADRDFVEASAEASEILYRYMQAPLIHRPSYLGDRMGGDQGSTRPEDRGMAAAFAVRGCPLDDAPHGLEQDASGTARWVVRGTHDLVILLSARTSFHGPDRHPWTDARPVLAPLFHDLLTEPFTHPTAAGMEAARRRHLDDHRSFFDRVQWIPGASADGKANGDTQPSSTAETDPAFTAIRRLFHFARYLMISGSRPDTQPLNLQGIWNEDFYPPWSSNYTLNINAEMNYWPAEILGLPECHEPLLRKAFMLALAGERTARDWYGRDGAVAHHNSDIWNHTEPVGALQDDSVVYAIWPMALGWLSAHLLRRAAYSFDNHFIHDMLLPTLDRVARFFLSTLRKHPNGSWVMAPSTSPEQKFVLPDGTTCALAGAASMSQAIIEETLRGLVRWHAYAESQGLAVAPTITETAQRAAKVLPDLWGPTVAPDGSLMEWDKDYPDAEPHHRHISHLYPLFPGDRINIFDTPELCEAARRTLAKRGDEGTGWSLGWKVLYYARLHDAEGALRLLKDQLRPVDESHGHGGSYPNLFSAHPPYQIDGNFASGAGIAAMFLQSELVGDDTIRLDLAPALPPAFGTGTIRGLRAVGGLTLDLSYRQGQITEATLYPSCPAIRRAELHHDGDTENLTLTPDRPCRLTLQDGVLQP